jgi:hypothetical protein
MYTPEFTGPIEGWTANHVNKNLWKVKRLYDRADLMQEAYLVFDRVAKKYPDLETGSQFMALYKMAWSNQMINFANADTKDRVMCQMPIFRDEGSASSEETGEREFIGEHYHDGYLAVMIKQAPKEVISVLNLFLSAPQELLDVALASWNGSDKRCVAGGSKKICKMLGLDPKLDVMRMVADYFRH